MSWWEASIVKLSQLFGTHVLVKQLVVELVKWKIHQLEPHFARDSLFREYVSQLMQERERDSGIKGLQVEVWMRNFGFCLWPINCENYQMEVWVCWFPRKAIRLPLNLKLEDDMCSTIHASNRFAIRLFYKLFQLFCALFARDLKALH